MVQIGIILQLEQLEVSIVRHRNGRIILILHALPQRAGVLQVLHAVFSLDRAILWIETVYLARFDIIVNNRIAVKQHHATFRTQS